MSMANSVRGTVIALAVASLTAMLSPQARADQQSDLIARGQYLARAADCGSCHTKESGGQPFAGGRYIETPFGPIGSPNITADKETGIGNWSDDDFYRALHDGISKNGDFIYPVMPFTSYTKMTRDDALAIKAYLFSVPPVHAPHVPNKLPFPFNVRASLAGWRLLFFKEGTFVPDPHASAQINRGAYLVEALAHCAMCHTARDALGGPEKDRYLAGGQVQGWYAPNITSDYKEGIGSWTNDQLFQYLKTGAVPGKTVAAGPMSEVVHSSLAYLTDDDVHDIAAYLKTTPPKAPDASSRLSPSVSDAQAVPAAYATNCSSCHGIDGKGLAGAVPPLAGNGAVSAAGPENVIRAILGGLPASNTYARMPMFADSLSNEDIAVIANYVRAAWGNGAPSNATTDTVGDLRKSTPVYLTGKAPECPSLLPQSPDEQNAASAQIADPKNGIQNLLQGLNDGNVLTDVQQMVAKVKAVKPGVGNADIINGLTDAYCPILAGRSDLSLVRKRWELNRLSQVVYVTLNQTKDAAK